MDDDTPFHLLPLWRVALYAVYAVAFVLIGLAGLVLARASKAVGLAPTTRPIDGGSGKPAPIRPRRPIL